MELSKKLFVAVVLLSFLAGTLPADPAADPGAGDDGDSGSSSSASSSDDSRWGEWQILTRRNFSSEIRRQHRILLMVTVPWCGESRSLRKELGNLVANKTMDFGSLSLMVVYRNSDKMLAEALGATDEITLFYYHYSTPYKYRGRLHARSILSSIYYFLSLKYEEVPLKNLRNKEDLDSFLLSTERAVILLEFCGWSTKLLRRENNASYETPLSSQNHSENADVFGQNPVRETDKLVQKYHKGTENKLTSRIEKAVADYPWLGTYEVANQSSEVTEERTVGAKMLCPNEDFQRFESFFRKFIAIAREHFLPLERLRFGLVSERSLLPFLGISSPDKWLVMLHLYGCPNCSVIVREEDDLRNVIQTYNSPVMELDVDGENSLEPTFPANKPSVILFIDRLSDSSRVRGESQLSLEVLRKFACHNQLPGQMDGKVRIRNPGRSAEGVSSKTWSKRVSGTFSRPNRNDHQTSKIVKIKDNMAFMIVNDGESISSKNTHLDNQEDLIYDTLLQLLQQKNPSMKTKDKKISLVAKEIGFELLSDDFEVHVMDSLPEHNDENRVNNMIENVVIMPKDQTSKLMDELSRSSNIVNKGGPLDNAEFTASSEGKLSEPQAVVPDIEQIQGTALIVEKDKDKSSTVKLKVDTRFLQRTQVNQDNEAFEPEETELSMSHEKNAYHLGQKSPTVEAHSLTQNANNVDCESNIFSRQIAPDIGHTCSFQPVRDEVTPMTRSMILRESDEQRHQHQPFLGSYYFSDGGYQLLKTLTAGSKIPSLVILDPVQRQHYVFSEDKDVTYSSLVSFVDRFQNGNLTPYQRSASLLGTSRKMPKPPFVNLDFHEADSIPQVDVNTFCELVVGFKACEIDTIMPVSNLENFGSAWNTDVLVLFSASWCGFCQRMELIVREVHRAFSSFINFSKDRFRNDDPLHPTDKKEELVSSRLSSILLMDCTRNDCGPFLKALGKKEQYPMLMLFPAKNKTAITYEGDMSVIGIIEFLESYGNNSDYLNKQKGRLWTHIMKGSKKVVTSHVSTLSIHEKAVPAKEKHSEFLLEVPTAAKRKHLIETYRSTDFQSEGIHVVVGSVLAASDKLHNAVPFDNSTVLIVAAEENEGFLGVIINKHISWDIFEELDGNLEPLKQAPIFYGGPVRFDTLLLVSLTRKPIKGYTTVTKGVYFGNLTATKLIIEKIKVGEESVDDFWFFLGFSSWGYPQLFDELREGAWQLSRYPIDYLDWPES